MVACTYWLGLFFAGWWVHVSAALVAILGSQMAIVLFPSCQQFT